MTIEDEGSCNSLGDIDCHQSEVKHRDPHKPRDDIELSQLGFPNQIEPFNLKSDNVIRHWLNDNSDSEDNIATV